MEKVVVLQNATKTFQQKKAVDRVSFTITKGEIAAILGPNGAGKSTTIMMMLGLLDPTEGSVQLFKQQPQEKAVRERIGVMLQEVSVMDGLKVQEILELFRSYYPQPLKMEELITLTGFKKEHLKKRTEGLSGGQKRRLNFALALAGNPDLLFLDEPTVGMDTTARRLFWETIDTLKKRGKTIVFSTHYLQEADNIADRILLFHHGKVVADGTPMEIKGKISKRSVSFTDDKTISLDVLSRLPHVQNVYRHNDRIYIDTDDTDGVMFVLMKQAIKMKNIQIEQGGLDEAFEQLTMEHKERL
jgi:ABC-2 type transport system ATP-binding protein